MSITLSRSSDPVAPPPQVLSPRQFESAGPAPDVAPPPPKPTPPPEPLSPPEPTPTAHRDRAIDLVRFACLVVVVILHSMMSSAVLGADGEVVPTVALSGTIGFTIASWFYQIMPLFFFIGGYAAISGWRRTRSKGGTWADYLRARLRRLVIPVAVLIGGAGVGLSIASELGVSPDLLAEASTRIGQPLWFLAVYVGLTCLVPLAVKFHETAPRRTLAALAGAVIAVDGMVALTGAEGLGYLNFLFVWPLIQQCGFVYADVIHRPVRRWAAVALIAAALAGLGMLVGLGVYSPNMLVNLNPPTGALVLLGLAQMGLLRLAHARLTEIVNGGRDERTRLDRARLWDRFITWGNTYGIQVYLWHMPIAITLIGGLGWVGGLLAGVPMGDSTSAGALVLPPIESMWWWMTRLPWLITVMGLAALLAMAMAKVPFPGEEKLARFGTAVAQIARDVLPSRGAESAATARDGAELVAAAHDGAEQAIVGEGRARSERGFRAPVTRALIAVVLAMGGIAIALLVGIAPLVWTVVSCAALIASLVVAASVRSPGHRETAS